jgi:hypothetical protein
MTGLGSAQEQLIAARDRHRNFASEIEKRLAEGNLDLAEPIAIQVQHEQNARDYLNCARNAAEESEIRTAIVELCSAIAERRPAEAIELAEQFCQLPTEDDAFAASIADALHIAYRVRGEAVRAEQQRAIAIRLRREYTEGRASDAVTWAGLMATLRSAATPLTDSGEFAIDPYTNLEWWLSTKTQLSWTDLAPAFGNFVSNDRKFYRVVRDRLQMLCRRLEAQLSKPDNYLLIAQPGSGKSFFVRQFKGELQSAVRKDITFLERNLSAYDSVEGAFEDIITDVVYALTSHRPVFLFIDEVDTLLDGKSMLERLIAPMNGDPFFFRGKQMSIANQDIVVFFALSSSPEKMHERQKWTDFLSRIPQAHRISLPTLESPIDRVYKAIAMLPRGKFPAARVQAVALLYIGLKNWVSVRELEQAVDAAKLRAATRGGVVTLELADIAVTPEDVEEVEAAVTKRYGGTIDIFGSSNHLVEIK